MALAEDKSGCLAAPVIAQRAYQVYLAKPADEDAGDSSLTGLIGYEAVKEAGLIDEGL
jgi:hypothetical protein